MKKLYAVFLLVLFLLLCISCNESKKNSRYIGQYQAVYVSPAKDMPYANIDLDIHSFQDTLRAKMAIHHYYKDNLLYSELTNECAPDFNKDTLIFHFSMQDEEMGGDLKECEREQRELCLKFKRDQDSLVLLSSSDDDILPDDFLVFRKAATSEDSAAIIVEKIYPRFTIAGIYYVSGPIKRLKTKETEYFFDEKGVLVQYKSLYDGRVYEAQIEVDEDGVTIATIDFGRGRKDSFHYNEFYQLFHEEVCLHYSSKPDSFSDYEYDAFGRLIGKSYCYTRRGKVMRIEYEFKRDKRGTVIGEICESDHEADCMLKVLDVDNYGNPLSVQYSYGYAPDYFTDPYSYEYEYYSFHE